MVLLNEYATDAELIQAIAWEEEALDSLDIQIGDITVMGALITEHDAINLDNYRTDGQAEFLTALAEAK